MEWTIRCVTFMLLALRAAAYYDEAVSPVRSTVSVWSQLRRSRLARDDDLAQCERPSVYICEEPPSAVSYQSTKQCNYRNVWYQEQVYRWVAGRGCLLYTPDFLYQGGANPLNLNSVCFYGNLPAPCLEIVKEDGTCGCFPFDPSLEEVALAVRGALLDSAHGRWESCFYEASDCCTRYEQHLNESTTAEETAAEAYCDTTFDGWTCWPSAPADTIAYEVCSEFAYSNGGPSCDHYSSKSCGSEGGWDIQSDYSSCSVTPRLLLRYQVHVAMLAVSLAACLPAVLIFYTYRRLRVTRVVLHRNLLIAIMLRNILVIISRSEVYMDELVNTGTTAMSAHSAWCRALAVAERVAANAVFVCMLLEGIYLHRLICAVFKTKLNINMLYAIGAVIATAPVAAWAVTMSYVSDHSCWLVYSVAYVQWLLDTPRVAILLLNTALFLDVLRVLLTKIRNAENVNQLSTTKATLFLMPVFGTQFLLTALRPATSSCSWEQAYYLLSYGLEGLQGLCVATMYCYLNKEVHMLVRGTYKKTEFLILSKWRKESNYRRPTSGVSSDRTLSTAADAAPEPPARPAARPPGAARPTPPGRPAALHAATLVSVQQDEKLAEIIDPVYETIQNGIVNEGYDSLDNGDNDSGFIRKDEPYYGFTNASSVSIDCQDWIRCISSPSSSVYDNSLNEYEVKYLERKFPHYHRERAAGDVARVGDERPISNLGEQNSDLGKHTCKESDSNDQQNTLPDVEPEVDDFSVISEDNSSIFNEIMRKIEKETEKQPEIVEVELDPELLSPNRGKDDKIIFV